MTDSLPVDDSTTIEDVFFEARHRARGQVHFIARHDGDTIHEDVFDPAKHPPRSKFLRRVLENLRQRGVERTEQDLETCFRVAISGCTTNQSPAAPETAQHSTIELPGPDFGLYRAGDNPAKIANFVPEITADVRTQDAGDERREFSGTVQTSSATSEWKISAEDYASDAKLKASLYAAAGSNLIMNCDMDELRNAIAEISSPRCQNVTTDFGWTAEEEYLTPGAVISAAGWRTAAEGDRILDLTNEDIPRQLGLLEPIPAEVDRLKRDVVPQLLTMSSPRVMLPLMGFVWLPVLSRFLPDARPFCLWLVGETGGGKSFAARLMQRFYGNFNHYLSWTSTANSLQRAGYFFRHALALFDDYKPDVANHRDVIRLLQSYADGSARGRLRKDATSNWSREIRGWVLSTGEDLPEHAPSALARTVIVRVPRNSYDLDRGRSCLAESGNFPRLTAAFIVDAMRTGRGQQFAQAVNDIESELQPLLHGQQNQGRIGRNFAMLLAATRQALEFLIENEAERQHWLQLAREYTTDMISEIVRHTSEQALHEVLLANLASMLASGRVQIHGLFQRDWVSRLESNHGEIIGRIRPGQPDLIEVNMNEALRAVNVSLRQQSKPEIKSTHAGLLDALRQSGTLLGPDGLPLHPDDPPTVQAQIEMDGTRRNLRVFTVHRRSLGIADDPSRPGGAVVGPQ